MPANDTRWNEQDGKIVCAEIYGGGFVPELSTSFQDNRTNDQINEAWFKIVRFSEWLFMTESFVFADYLEVFVQQNEVLPEKRNATTAFILPDEGATFGGLGSSALSLTPDSRILETLYTEGMVPSKSWSLTNESLCLGCVDENAYTGEFQALKPANRDTEDGQPCLLQTKVETVVYHLTAENAGVPLIDTPFTACVDPGVAFLVLPTEAAAKLLTEVGASVKATSNESITFAGSPKTDSSILRFKLDNGLMVNITVAGAGGSGGQDNGEWVLPVGTGNWGAYGENIPVLGRPFTDSVVLRWDESAHEYGLAQRNPKEIVKSTLIPLGCSGFPSMKKAGGISSSVGVIVGSILGGFLAGLLFAAAAVFFFWRGQKGVKVKYEAMHGEDAVSLRTVDTSGRTLESQMSGALGPPAPSVKESLRSHFGTRSVSQLSEPYLVDDSEVFEAPEGGTADPTKRHRGEMGAYSYHHR